jgi:hypothetical protein
MKKTKSKKAPKKAAKTIKKINKIKKVKNTIVEKIETPVALVYDDMHISTELPESVNTGSFEIEAAYTSSFEQHDKSTYDIVADNTAYTYDYKPYAPTTCGQNKDGIVLFLCISFAAIIILCIMLT